MASTLTRAVLAELETLKADNAALRSQVAGLETVLAPAFARPRQAPRDPYVPQSWCGEGGCRPASPCPSCQGAAPGQRSPQKTSDPWRGDYEHDHLFMDSARAGVQLAELRARAARDSQLRQQAAERAAGPAVLWPSNTFCGAPGCRPATPCPDCAGQYHLVKDKSEELGGREQRTLIHASVPALASERPGSVNAGIGAIGTVPIPEGRVP